MYVVSMALLPERGPGCYPEHPLRMGGPAIKVRRGETDARVSCSPGEQGSIPVTATSHLDVSIAKETLCDL